MINTICKREYKCKCGTLNEDYVWQSELNKHTFKCSKCHNKLGIKNLNIKKVNESASIRTPTKNR